MLPEDLSTLRVVDLKEELSKRNLPLKGKKDDLIARLQQSLDEEKQQQEAAEPPVETLAQVDTTPKENTEENQPQSSDDKATTTTQETNQQKEPVQDVTTNDKSTPDTTIQKEEAAKSVEEDDRGTKRKRSVDEKEDVKGESVKYIYGDKSNRMIMMIEPQPEKRTKPDDSVCNISCMISVFTNHVI